MSNHNSVQSVLCGGGRGGMVTSKRSESGHKVTLVGVKGAKLKGMQHDVSEYVNVRDRKVPLKQVEYCQPKNTPRSPFFL